MAEKDEKEHIVNHTAEWENNHSIIAKAFLEFIDSENKRPTIAELAKKTGFVFVTIQTHLKALSKTEFAERWQDFKILSDQILLKLGQKAMKDGPGAVAATKLFFEIVENFKPGMNLEVSEGVNFQNMTIEDLLELRRQREQIIDTKLLRFARVDPKSRGTGSDRS